MIMQKDAMEAMVNMVETLPVETTDPDQEAAQVFRKARGGKARALLLQPHLSQHAPNPQRTKDDAETVAKILERDRKKHDNLPIPIKVVRGLMERGLAQDPQFERDCEGLTAV